MFVTAIHRRPRSGARPSWGMAAMCLVLCGLAAGCRGAGGSTQDVVAQVGEVPVSWGELELYLKLNLFTDEDGGLADSGEEDRVKSRLIDALVDEKTFLIEAERRGLRVSDLEIDAYLAADVEDDAAMTALSQDRRRLLVRQRLMVQKLHESVAQRLPPPSDDEISAFIEQSRGSLAPRKRLRLRALRFESADDAARAAKRIHAGRMSFAEAVVTYEIDPGQGVLLERSWETLSPVVRAALEGLKPGEVTRPVDVHGETFLFQLDSWLTDPSVVDEDLARRAREQLERLRLREASDRLLRDLRAATPVRIHAERLPFRYVPEAS
jgi:peptidyl-prolyl cis-trans isomerase SurA